MIGCPLELPQVLGKNFAVPLEVLKVIYVRRSINRFEITVIFEPYNRPSRREYAAPSGFQNRMAQNGIYFKKPGKLNVSNN